MITVELNTRVTGLDEAFVVALGDALDGFGANMTYDMDSGRLYLKAAVADLKVFIAMHAVLETMLVHRAPHLHYAYRVTQEGVLY